MRATRPARPRPSTAKAPVSAYADPELRTPRRGQRWRAASPKTRGGYRYIDVQRVYHPLLALPTATVREVSRSGRDLYPDHVGPTGEEVSTSFDVVCYPDGGMPRDYELVFGPKPPKAKRR